MKEETPKRSVRITAKLIWMLFHVLIPLIAGRIFGITVERILFVLLLGKTSVDLISTLEMFHDVLEDDELLEEMRKENVN